MSDTITHEQWVARCAKRLMEIGKLEEPVALQIAEAQLRNLCDDLAESPEGAADLEMSYWEAE